LDVPDPVSVLVLPPFFAKRYELVNLTHLRSLRCTPPFLIFGAAVRARRESGQHKKSSYVKELPADG